MTQRTRRFGWYPRYEDFRYRTISAQELPHVMRRHILTGAMGNIYGTLTTGMFLVAFGEEIGISIEQWGILGAVSSFAISLQLVSAYWAARIGHRRLLWFVFETVNRALRCVAFVLALSLLSRDCGQAAAGVFIFLLCAASFFAAAAMPPWFSWLADIIPETVHGHFMGRRDAWIALATIAIVLPAGWWLDATDDSAKIYVLEVVFLVGILLGMIDLFLHRIIPEPPAAREAVGSFLEHVLAPLRDREYRPWLVFSIVWNFAVFLGGALATVFFVNDLGIRQNFLGGAIVLIVIPLFGVMLTSKWSGALVDRLGVKRVIIVSHFLWAILPVFWIVASPSTAMFWLGLSSAVGGAGFSAAVNASNKLMTRVPPPHQRAMYIAVTACLNNLSGGVATLLAGYFLAALRGHEWPLFGMVFIPFHLLFAVSLVLRLLSWLLAFRIRTPVFDNGKR